MGATSTAPAAPTLVGLAVLMLTCTPASPPSHVAPTTTARCQEVNPHRDTARHVLEVHCGRCHRQDSPQADARALAIFNLNEVEWAHSLDARQLEALGLQLQENGATRGTEDAETLGRFVEAELALRACR
jgi:hypothetical protein